ncbi:MAG: hypothetical protein EBR30_03540 [Cytophagia bacterium]|nr:hypothetical protein [Cytophagia bacterium]NBW34086.1 hypothetical protein [Cytophagia bacterium]
MAYQIELSWTPPTGGNVTSQEVQRKTASTSFATIATLGPTASTYIDTNVVENVLYDYQVVSICSNGATGQSNSDVAGLPTCPLITNPILNDTSIIWNLPALPSNTDSYYAQYNIVSRPTITGGGSIIVTNTVPVANKRGPYQITLPSSWFIPDYFYELQISVCIDNNDNDQCVQCTVPPIQV